MNAVFKALNDPTRREILQLLKQDRKTAGEIAAQFSISKPSISHHLDILKRAGLVSNRREGQYQFYELNTSIVEDLMEWVLRLKN